jgi:hypothetical protein
MKSSSIPAAKPTAVMTVNLFMYHMNLIFIPAARRGILSRIAEKKYCT